MPVKGIVPVTKPGNNNEWSPVPEDIYQVVIKDIIEKDVPVYGTNDGSMETKYLFKYIILDEGEAKEQMLTDFAPPKWFGGNTKKKFSPSKLVTIFKAVYGFYYPKLNVNDLSEPSPEVVNDLIGKQVRVTVKLGGDNNQWNKITDYTVVKAELPVPDSVKIEAVKNVAVGTIDPQAAAANAEEAKAEESESGEEMEEDIDRPLPWEGEKKAAAAE